MGVKEEVELAITKMGVVSLAVDGWEDDDKLPTLAFTAHVPNGATFLCRFQRINVRETDLTLSNFWNLLDQWWPGHPDIGHWHWHS